MNFNPFSLRNFLGVLHVPLQKPKFKLPYRNRVFSFPDKCDIERNASHLLIQRILRTARKTLVLTTSPPREPWLSCYVYTGK